MFGQSDAQKSGLGRSNQRKGLLPGLPMRSERTTIDTSSAVLFRKPCGVSSNVVAGVEYALGVNQHNRPESQWQLMPERKIERPRPPGVTGKGHRKSPAPGLRGVERFTHSQPQRMASLQYRIV